VIVTTRFAVAITRFQPYICRAPAIRQSADDVGARVVLPIRSLPARLGLLVVGTALPLIVFAAGLIYEHHVDRRDTAFVPRRLRWRASR